jgi:hypothetical protein
MVVPVGMLPMDREKRAKIAFRIALGVDALQIVVFPLLFPGTPWNNVLDVLTGIFMVAILGWHVAFLPTFVTELIPFVDLFPTWTVAVLFITRKQNEKV